MRRERRLHRAYHRSLPLIVGKAGQQGTAQPACSLDLGDMPGENVRGERRQMKAAQDGIPRQHRHDEQRLEPDGHAPATEITQHREALGAHLTQAVAREGPTLGKEPDIEGRP